MTWPTYPKELTDAAWQKAKGLKARITTKTNVGAKLKEMQEEFELIDGKRFTDLPASGGKSLFSHYARMESHAGKFEEWKKTVTTARSALESTKSTLTREDAKGNKSMIDHLALVDAHLENLVKSTQQLIVSAMSTAKHRQDQASDHIHQAKLVAGKLIDALDGLNAQNFGAEMNKTTGPLKQLIASIWQIDGIEEQMSDSTKNLRLYMKLDQPRGDVEKDFKKPVKAGLQGLIDDIPLYKVDAYHFKG